MRKRASTWQSDPARQDAGAELREIANGRGDLLAERVRITLGFYARENRDEWQSKAIQAALLIAAGADLTRVDRRGARAAKPSVCPSG